jgi:hypothetical protein
MGRRLKGIVTRVIHSYHEDYSKIYVKLETGEEVEWFYPNDLYLPGERVLCNQTKSRGVIFAGFE